MLALERMALHATRLLRSMIKLEAGRVCNIIVPPVPERIVWADNDGLAAAGQLHRGELLFIILLKRGAQLLYDAWLGYRDGLDVCVVLQSGGQLSRRFVRDRVGEWIIVGGEEEGGLDIAATWRATCLRRHLQASMMVSDDASV